MCRLLPGGGEGPKVGALEGAAAACGAAAWWVERVSTRLLEGDKLIPVTAAGC